MEILANFPTNITRVQLLSLARVNVKQVAAGATEASDSVTGPKRLIVREVESAVLHACIIPHSRRNANGKEEKLSL